MKMPEHSGHASSIHAYVMIFMPTPFVRDMSALKNNLLLSKSLLTCQDRWKGMAEA
jgi:hypothetical protein